MSGDESDRTWQRWTDSETESHYWHNPATGESVWVDPYGDDSEEEQATPVIMEDGEEEEGEEATLFTKAEAEVGPVEDEDTAGDADDEAEAEPEPEVEPEAEPEPEQEPEPEAAPEPAPASAPAPAATAAPPAKFLPRPPPQPKPSPHPTEAPPAIKHLRRHSRRPSALKVVPPTKAVANQQTYESTVLGLPDGPVGWRPTELDRPIETQTAFLARLVARAAKLRLCSAPDCDTLLVPADAEYCHMHTRLYLRRLVVPKPPPAPPSRS